MEILCHDESTNTNRNRSDRHGTKTAYTENVLQGKPFHLSGEAEVAVLTATGGSAGTAPMRCYDA